MLRLKLKCEARIRSSTISVVASRIPGMPQGIPQKINPVSTAIGLVAKRQHCSHPPYSTQMHPPTFSAYAREEDPQTTTATAFVLPRDAAVQPRPQGRHGPDHASPVA